MYKAAFSRHLGQLAIALSLLGLTGLAHSAPDTQFKSAFQQFMQANSGDNSAIHRAAEAFAALYKNAPSNPVLLAYTGAATAMRATTTMLPWKKWALPKMAWASWTRRSPCSTPHTTPLDTMAHRACWT